MWERKAQAGKWNGNVLNILSTTLDGGKRLHVSELPYTDLPHIKVMGSKARTISIEVVFVGANSLVESNATILELETNPEGTLEHPYLGEVDVVYETYSQSFNTTKGLVTLSLKFYKQGESIELISLDQDTPAKLIDTVMEESNAVFIDAVSKASADEVDAMKLDFGSVLSALRNVANRSAQSSVELGLLHRQIEDGFTAIESIKNSPGALSDHLHAIMNNLKKTLFGKETTSISQKPAAIATQSLSSTINPDATFSHCNLQVTVALILFSVEMDALSIVEEVDASVVVEQSLTEMIGNISFIQNQLDDRINEVTKAATFESLALCEAVESLRTNVNQQVAKLIEFKESLYQYDVPRTMPLVCLAQRLETNTSALNSVNKIKHPLFVSGELQVINA
tara:strand:+ start:13677 stop:14864 length:1188 start_codon:yes stop_codon:yes gene_type:complete